MKLQIEDKISEIADKARERYDEALDRARANTKKAAGRVSKGKKPVRTVSRFGVRLSGVSHRTVNKLWKRQTKLVEDQFDAVADRLKAAANADDLRNLVETQVELIPDYASRFKVELRESIDIVKGAGSEIRDILTDTVKELKGEKKTVRKAAESKKPATPEPSIVSDEIAA